MYFRIDPAKSAGTDYFVIDQNTSLQQLKNSDQVDCFIGSHFNLPNAVFQDHQTITCISTGSPLYTLIYKA